MTSLWIPILVMAVVSLFSVSATAQEKYEVDTLKTAAGDLRITFIGHGSLIFILK